MNQVATNIGPNIDAIHPRNGAKYSPNLHKWVKAQKRPDQLQVLRDIEGRLWIGHVDDCGDGHWLHGCRLMGVLCNGLKEERMAYHFKGHLKSPDVIHDFWAQYERDGRCATDREHSLFFVGDETRWARSGDTRQCTWCGAANQTLRRWTETVQRERWK